MKMLFWKKKEVVRTSLLDQAVAEHKRMLKGWGSKQQLEIIAAILADHGCHIRRNPKKKSLSINK